MKTAAKVLYIITLVFSIIGMLVLLGIGIFYLIQFLQLSGQSDATGETAVLVTLSITLAITFILSGLALIIPIIVNIIGIVLINKATSKSTLIPIAIISLILGINFIGSILLLCMKDEDLK